MDAARDEKSKGRMVVVRSFIIDKLDTVDGKMEFSQSRKQARQGDELMMSGSRAVDGWRGWSWHFITCKAREAQSQYCTRIL